MEKVNILKDRLCFLSLNKITHRVEILQLIPNGASSLAVVKYIDHGSQAMLDTSTLHPLVSQFRDTPCLAVSASLADVSDQNWSPEQCFWFNNR